MIVRKEMDFEGHRIAYWEGGAGDPLLLIHGSGPGASTNGNWREVLDPLAQSFHVIAPDLIGFGESGRKSHLPYFDLDLWSRQSKAMLSLFGGQRVGVLAHSLSGSIALRLGAGDGNISRVMTTGTMGVWFDLNEHLVRTWTFPGTRDAIRKAGLSLVFDPTIITDQYIDGRSRVLYAGDYGSYFDSMFSGDKAQYIRLSTLPDDIITSVNCDVMLVHGLNDLAVPLDETSLKLVRKLPKADLVVLSRCGHSPALEHPTKLVALVRLFFGA